MDIKRQICDLFEVHADEGGVTRVVTPLEYVGSGDNVVVRVRPQGQGYSIDENGEAAFSAAMSGGDMDSEVVARWISEFHESGPVLFDEETELLHSYAENQEVIVPYIFRVAEAAQRLHAVATSRVGRQESDFKEKVKELVVAVARELDLRIEHDVDLPIAGNLTVDHVIHAPTPLLIVSASYPARLLEAEVIYMQYRADKRPAHVWAIAESQAAVGRKHFERAGYYTNRAVVYQPESLRQLVAAECSPTLQ